MFCPQCGAPNEEDAVFCGNCGAVLNPDELPVETEAQEVEAMESVEPEDRVVDEDLFLEELPPAPVPPVPPPPPPPTAYAVVAQTSGMAIASLVMGILGWTLLPLIGSILAIVFGYAARNEIRQRPDELEGEGLAVAGLVLGWLMIGISILLLCLGGLGFCFFFGVIGASGGY